MKTKQKLNCPFNSEELKTIARRARELDATVEVWNCGRLFLDAPKGQCWSCSETHALTYSPADHGTTKQFIDECLCIKNCPEDCIFDSSGDNWTQPRDLAVLDLDDLIRQMEKTDLQPEQPPLLNATKKRRSA